MGQSTVTSRELAALLDLTATSISRLAAEGVVPSTGSGRERRFPIPDAVAAYCRHMRSPQAKPGLRSHDPQDPLKAARIRAMEAQAARAELRHARDLGDLLDRGDVERTWTAAFRRVRAEVLALPTRIAGRLGHLSAHDLGEIDAEIRAVLEEVATADAPETSQGDAGGAES